MLNMAVSVAQAEHVLYRKCKGVEHESDMTLGSHSFPWGKVGIVFPNRFVGIEAFFVPWFVAPCKMYYHRLGYFAVDSGLG